MESYNRDYNFFPSGVLDIETSTNISSCSDDNCILKIYYKYSNIRLTKNNDFNIEILIDKDNYIIYNGLYYRLDYITFSNGSYHKNDNVNTDLEIYMVHTRCEDEHCNSDSKLIFHLLVKESDIEQNEFFNNITNLNVNDGKDKFLFNFEYEINPFNIIPEDSSYYEYGDESVIHILFENVIYINNNLIDDLLEHTTFNSMEIKNYTDNINYNNVLLKNNTNFEFNIVSEDELVIKGTDTHKDNIEYTNTEYVNLIISLFKYIFICVIGLILVFIIKLFVKLDFFKDFFIKKETDAETDTKTDTKTETDDTKTHTKTETDDTKTDTKSQKERIAKAKNFINKYLNKFGNSIPSKYIPSKYIPSIPSFSNPLNTDLFKIPKIIYQLPFKTLSSLDINFNNIKLKEEIEKIINNKELKDNDKKKEIMKILSNHLYNNSIDIKGKPISLSTFFNKYLVIIITIILIWKFDVYNKLFPYNTDTEKGIEFDDLPEETIDRIINTIYDKEELLIDLLDISDENINRYLDDDTLKTIEEIL